jgi:membrane protease YdiL (CAAX protease family)
MALHKVSNNKVDTPRRRELKPAPILKMLGVMAVVAWAIVLIDHAFERLPGGVALAERFPWIVGHAVHVPQFAIPFALIWTITRGRLGEYGFNLNQRPPVFTHRRMLGLGALSGLLMSVRYLPQVIQGTPVGVPRPVTAASVVGNMAFQWVVVGLSEETMFRGLIQTTLMNHLSGRATLLGHDLHIGTILGALLWGAFHLINILVMPLGSVLFVVLLTTVAGLLMGYAYQETRSLLTTIIVHSTMFGVPLTVGYILYWLL